MAQKTPDIRVLVGVKGGATIDGESGKLILNELTKIAKDISGHKTPPITFTVDSQSTTQNITKELNEIVKGLRLQPVDLSVHINQTSAGSFIENEYKKLIEGTRGNKSKANIIAHIEEKRALIDIEVQKKKNEESTQRQTKAEKERLAIVSRIADTQRLLNSAENNANKSGNTGLAEDIRNKEAELNQFVQKFGEFQASIGGSENLWKHLDSSNYIELASEIESCNKAARELQKLSSTNNPLLVKNERIAKQARDLSDFSLSLEKFAKANNKFKNSAQLAVEFENINTSLDNLKRRSKSGENIGVEFEKLKVRTNNWKESIEEAGLTGQTNFSKLKSQMEKLGVYFSASAVMMVSWQQIKKMTNNVIELDSAMTELRKVTDETNRTYSIFLDNAEVRAKKIGASLSDTVTATADFARLGFSLAESEQISDAALVYKNVGDGIQDINSASESVISTMKAFNIEASNAMSIVDRFNDVGNNFAISSKGVGDALQRSASALATAGNSIDESIALIVGANAVVQDPDVVGNALKTAALRLTSSRGELEALGEDAEGAAESITKLQTQLLNLTKGQVDIMLDSDSFKSTYQIMLEISKVWDTMSQKDQMDALELMFGKRGANVGSSIITNMADAEKALETSINSAGSALAENEKVLDSIRGKMSQFEAQYEALSNTIISSELIKGTVDFGTGFLEFLDKTIDKLGTIPTLATITAGALSAFGNKGKQCTYALYNLVVTRNEPVVIGERLYGKSLKWCA